MTSWIAEPPSLPDAPAESPTTVFPAPNWVSGTAQAPPLKLTAAPEGAPAADGWLARVETAAPARPEATPEKAAPPPPRARVVAEIDDPVGIAADAAFAQVATQAALSDALKSAGRVPLPDPHHPANQHAAEWTPELVQTGKVIHAFIGIEDPLAIEAQTTFDETEEEAELRAAVAQIEGADLDTGELAALDAFDDALERGADMHEALSAAIAAAEAAGGPEWNAPREEFLDPPTQVPLATASFQRPRAAPELALTGLSTPPVFLSRDDEPSAARPGFNVLLEGPAADGPFGLDGPAQDSAFGFGFQFSEPVVYDYQRRLAAAGAASRNDAVTAAAALTTVTGTAGADFLLGTEAADAVAGLGGNDFVYTDRPDNYDAASHDASTPLTSPTFASAGSNDVASGGAGDDSIWGGGGDDRLHGDIPATTSDLYQEFGFGLGDAGFGNDALWGGDGADTLYGGDGNDTLTGEAGGDILDGGAGNDSLYGGGDADNIFGYAGDDVLVGGTGDDELAGGDGADEFRFAGGTGADALAHAQSLGTDTITDYSAADADTFGISDADFGFGTSGTLTDGTNYFEAAAFTLGAAPVDVSSGAANAGFVVLGQNSGTDGVALYYTQDASAMSNANSYQIADIIGVNMSDVEAADFFLKS